MPFELALAIRQNLCQPRSKLSAVNLSTSSRTLGRRYWRVWQLDLVNSKRFVVSFLLTIIFPKPKQHSSLNLNNCYRSCSSCLICSLLSIPSTSCVKSSGKPCFSISCWVLIIFLVVRVSCIGQFFSSLDLNSSQLLCNFSNFFIQVSGVILGSSNSSKSISSWLINISLFSLSAASYAYAIFSHKLQVLLRFLPP